MINGDNGPDASKFGHPRTPGGLLSNRVQSQDGKRDAYLHARLLQVSDGQKFQF